jgi:hypothetical protein
VTDSDGTVPPERGLRRATQPGDTRFWYSCDPDRRHPFFTSITLVEHVMQARAHDAGHGGAALDADQPK